ncbi:Gfo/Idh/MocA family oxidoreductase [Arthrobacter sp. TES]|uniref:Inositol 2-dehydrogenase n=1 Tax=Paenarthrobacter ureafaciens TaxID=37931 RepID=A0AAX3EL69_PAEUR|nr:MULTISPECIES: Gfo/Idh/MocA family oxidoreductase [Paenarthrobacter]AMB39571.1 inositol 2-dehydrogenase [Arthrobacter sp. ATCC 21022]AOY72481.1 inositol 2-dehydrogenase [Arthrobacter sp. ZXY-2]ERI36374.1 inositol 2-dehydrogenase [Arthrobacter sp. AK-YN10]NKR11151.1 inositol 2-dehydrogenase [Arthrobacter sp. M5]NKR15277.1 inositol 2-dehydrogenase [Arthrobacter sp. M6]OEH59239.1 inositol 2-dehydrogenase [Arthrobacter sp. D4]OEH59418.1 inositol 2-dehydrogenase [Arthrobacter sp. D2]QOI64142.1
MTKTLRVAVIGAGRMGADHIKRLSTRIHGAEVAAVVDVDLARAQAAIEGIDGAVALASADEALNNGDVNAVLIATPGFLHEEILYKALEKDFPILCEKPLTPDAESSWKVVQAELVLGHKRIQVGFMRRFDAEYSALGSIIRNSELGELLMLHHQHRNPSTPEGFTNEMLINDSVVHEFDAIRYFTGEEITSVQVRLGKPTRNAPNGQHDPQQVLIETESGVLADVEIYVNAKFGYQVATQASFEDGIVSIGGDSGPYVQTAGKWGGNVTPGFEDRFGAAYDVEVQAWVDAALRGEIGGPTAWDGYATAACCEAGVEAQKSGEKVKVHLNAKPDLYK